MRFAAAQLLSLGYLVTAGIGARQAIREDLPGAFMGRTTGWSARKDFLVGSGTALSPPLSMLAVQALLTAVSTRRGRAQQIGLTGLALTGAGEIVGVLGEPITHRVLRPRNGDPRKVPLVLALLVLPALTVVLSLSELLRQR